MNSALRATLLLAIALSCFDAQARTIERCVLSLEARPANVERPGEPPRVDRFGKPRCLLAVVYPGGEAARTDARNPRILPPIASDDQAGLTTRSDMIEDAARASNARYRPVQHV